MPTFNKAFKEVGIVPITIIYFMVNRHKEVKTKDFWLNIKDFLGALGELGG